MKHFLTVTIQVVLGLAAFRGPGVRAAVAPAQPETPNFLVIFGEAQGWASSSVAMDAAMTDSKNSLARTPALERLAAEGARFSRFYAASPRCTPTRAALVTGRSPTALHMTFVGESRKEELSEAGRRVIAPNGLAELPETEVTLAELLKKRGYATAHFGKWHLGKANPARHGFDENDGANTNFGPDGGAEPNPKQAFEITRKGVDFMEKQVSQGRPFYLQVSHYAGNGDVAARPETYSEVRRRAKPGEEKKVETTAMTEDMDATIGMLLQKIDQLGIAGRTVVVFTADHGSKGHQANAPLNAGKGTVMEGGIRVPLMIRGPGVQKGLCSPALASTVDVFPTLASFAGIREGLPPGLEGGDLMPILSGRSQEPVRRARPEFVVHFPHYDKDPAGPASALILGNEKLVRFYETGASHLYDLAHDIGERRDLAAAKPERVRELDRMLTAYLGAVRAQMPSVNAAFDPKAPPPTTKRGGRKKEAK
jgi:arylsulfatase A